MQPQRREQFLTKLEHEAASHGITADVEIARRRPHYHVTLVSSRSAADRISFILGTHQEISLVTYRRMLSTIERYLANESLSDAAHRFGVAAREAVLALQLAAGSDEQPATVAADADQREIAAEPERSAGVDAGMAGSGAPPLPLRGKEQQRAWFLQNIACLNSVQLAELGIAGTAVPESEEPSGTRFLAIKHADEVWYPAFQFREGKPVAAVADVLRVFDGHRSDWQIAFWFVAANSWLDGQRPVDRLDDGQTVIAAAIQNVNALVA